MIVEIGGGNSGIAEYLVDGVKRDREYTRDELDNRVILDGDLNLTESIINSIEDKGQERYLHLSLSFAEDDVSNDLLNNVLKDYKDMLLSAYDTDEYNFYAEAHLPKIRNYIDPQTGENKVRKPHIHIVIPKVNLVSGASLNPTGMVRGGKHGNIQHLNAIQEIINTKYRLVSPKDRPRDLSNGGIEPLELHVADFKGERSRELKSNIVLKMNEMDVKSYDEFKSILSEFGEVREYNKGKDNEYLGVKQSGSDKFTRLKNSVFLKENIESTNKNKVLYRDDKVEIKKNIGLVKDWETFKAKEIRYLPTISQARREVYYDSAKTEKIEILNNLEESHDRRFKFTRESRGRKRSLPKSVRDRKPLRGIKDNPRKSFSTAKEIGLPPLRERNLVHGLQGRHDSRTRQPERILPTVSSSNVAEIQQTKLNNDRGVRWVQEANDGRGRGRVTEAILDASFSLDNETKLYLDVIKKEIDPDRFISYCVKKYNVDPKDIGKSKGRDGSPRFKHNQYNFNAIDYLTKALNVNLKEAVNELSEVYQDQLNGVKYDKISSYRRGFELEELKKKRESFKEKSREVFLIKISRSKDLDRDYKYKLKAIDRAYSLSDKEKDIMRGIYAFEYLVEKSLIEEKHKDIRASIISDHYNQSIENKVEYSDKFLEYKERMSGSMEDNVIINDDNSLQGDFKRIIETNEHYAKFEAEVAKRKDINELYSIHKMRLFKPKINPKTGRPVPPKSIIYRDRQTKKDVFVDRGNHIFFKQGKPQKGDVGLLAEYAHQKFGKSLKLTGNREFKTAMALAFAEKGLDVALRPKEFQNLYLKQREMLNSNELFSGIRIPNETIANPILTKNEIPLGLSDKELESYTFIVDPEKGALLVGANGERSERSEMLSEMLSEYKFNMSEKGGNLEFSSNGASAIDFARMADELERKGFKFEVVGSANVDMTVAENAETPKEDQTMLNSSIIEEAVHAPPHFDEPPHFDPPPHFDDLPHFDPPSHFDNPALASTNQNNNELKKWDFMDGMKAVGLTEMAKTKDLSNLSLDMDLSSLESGDRYGYISLLEDKGFDVNTYAGGMGVELKAGRADIDDLDSILERADELNVEIESEQENSMDI